MGFRFLIFYNTKKKKNKQITICTEFTYMFTLITFQTTSKNSYIGIEVNESSVVHLK